MGQEDKAEKVNDHLNLGPATIRSISETPGLLSQRLQRSLLIVLDSIFFGGMDSLQATRNSRK